MSEQNHPWCRDVQRDEAIRRAEDAAAAERTPLPDHRDLPAAVAELRERVARLEAVIPKSVSVSNAEAHENKGGTMPADGLRTERVTLEITHDIQSRPVELATWVRSAVSWKLRTGESVRVVEEAHFDDLAQVAMERDAAREECERLRARVAELEAAAAANAGGEQSQPPRGWLTAEDREALYLACAVLHGVFVGSWREKHEAAERLEAIRVRAIREAGGEVE